MGLSWQQGPLSPGSIGRFLVPEPLPQKLLYAEPLRRRMRVRFGGTWIADSEHVLILFEPGRYPAAYHRIDIRQSSRNLVVRHRNRVVADTRRALVLYESGFAARCYILRADIDESALTPVEHQTFCPYKGVCSYYDIGDARLAAWSYPDTYPEVHRVANLVSFEPDLVDVYLDGAQLHLEPGQTVVAHGPDRDPHLRRTTPGRPTGMSGGACRGCYR